jgi:iron complex transport system permease protein
LESYPHTNQADWRPESSVAVEHSGRTYLLTVLVLAAALVISVAVGAVTIPVREILALLVPASLRGMLSPNLIIPASDRTIVLEIRLPRTVLIALVGAGLAGSGAAYQGLFRNPLADPYLLGVASGAGLGAILAMSWEGPGGVPVFARLGPSLGLYFVPAVAFAGALLTVLLVYRLGRTRQDRTGVPDSHLSYLILAGVAIGALATALTSFLILRFEGDMQRAIVWMLGGYALGGWQPVWALLPYILIGLVGLSLLGRPLNVLQFGEEQALQLGLDVPRARLAIVVLASLTTAAAVSFAGIIGFVGLAVPHLVRMMIGSDYRRLVPMSILSGAILLLLADVLARTAEAPQEIPVGIVTALLGVPFFLYLLRTSSRLSM